MGDSSHLETLHIGHLCLEQEVANLANVLGYSCVGLVHGLFLPKN